MHQSVEDEAMDDVGERVPVRNVLGIFRTLHHPMPEFDSATFANGLTTHSKQDDREDKGKRERPDDRREANA